MATVNVLTQHEAANKDVLADRGLTLAGMVGAVAGALAGTLVGTEVGTAHPVIFGGAGTMLGSALFAGAWWAIASVVTGGTRGE